MNHRVASPLEEASRRKGKDSKEKLIMRLIMLGFSII
jgi:hypothetical protein